MTLKVIYRGALSPFSGYGNDGIDLVRALMACGADVYLHPTHVDAPLPEDVAHLLTKPLKAPFDLFLHHADPGGLGLTPEQVRSAKVAVAWTMWESSSLDNLKGRTNLARKLDSYDVLLSYDQVCDEAFAPHTTRKDSPVRAVLQGGFDPTGWKHVERDWYGDRFAFCMVGQLHERKDPFLAIQAFQELKEEKGPLFEGAELHLKAQPLDSGVLTVDGWKAMGDLQVGDLLVDPVSGSQKVEGVYPQGVQDVYRVSLSDGSTAECTLDHLWRVKLESGRWQVKTLSEILESGLRRGKHIRWEVPAVAPVVFAPQAEPVWDPYFLGLLLGDGSLTQQVKFGSADPELLEACLAALPSGVSPGSRSFRTNTEWITLCGAQDVARDLGVFDKRSWEKFVPVSYLRGTPEERLALLQGLMDTDGTSATANSAPVFCTTSERLARDVQELVRSLGGNAPLHVVDRSSYTYKGERLVGRTAYQVKVILDRNPFRLRRKAEQWDSVSRKHLIRRRIVGVEKVRTAECQCIKVSGEEQVYVTDDYVVTHNTNIRSLHPAMEETIPKLRIHYDVWPKETLRQFYASQHVLLAPSRGEGKNLPALEFQSTGGAVIATDWGGMRSWLSPTYAYPLDYTLAPVSPNLPNCLQARASKDHLKALMYEVYSVRPKVKTKAELAARIIPDMMSWDRVVERLFRVVAEALPPDRASSLTTRYHLAQGGR